PTMRIAHISDIHILHLEGVRPWRYLGKRLTGGANLLLHRYKAHSADAVRRAFTQIQADGADHTVITGDISNLALESEFAEARRIIEECAGDGSQVSVIPGNHDYYTWNAARTRRFERFFAPWMRSDLPEHTADGIYPYVKLLSDTVALVGLSTGIVSPPLFAVGKVGGPQRAALAKLLDHPELQARFVIVALHHNLFPPRYPKSPRKEWLRRLIDADEVMTTLRQGRVRLVLHGHTHQFGFSSHPHMEGDELLHVSETGSTSTIAYNDPHYGGKYALYDIEEEPNLGCPRLTHLTTRLYQGSDQGFTTWHERSFDDTTPSAVPFDLDQDPNA
ncbi:MAG: metallophosphoesterase, partial [Myxococcota bacterium]